MSKFISPFRGEAANVWFGEGRIELSLFDGFQLSSVPQYSLAAALSDFVLGTERRSLLSIREPPVKILA